MFKINGCPKILICFLSLSFITLHRAYGYMDPGTGSYVLQLIIAGIVSASLAIRIFWQKIRSLFSSNKSEDETEE